MEMSQIQKKAAQLLVVVGWFLLLISSLSIGQFERKVARYAGVEAFIANPGASTRVPFFAYMIGVLLISSPGVLLGLVAWFLGEHRSAKVLMIVGTGVMIFAVIYNLIP